MIFFFRCTSGGISVVTSARITGAPEIKLKYETPEKF